VGRALGASKLLACSARGKRQRGRPLNASVRCHLGLRDKLATTDLGARVSVGAWSVPFFLGGGMLVEGNDLASASIAICVGVVIVAFAIIASPEAMKVVWPFPSGWKRK